MWSSALGLWQSAGRAAAAHHALLRVPARVRLHATAAAAPSLLMRPAAVATTPPLAAWWRGPLTARASSTTTTPPATNEPRKKVAPYGTTSFAVIQEDGKFYADRTMYIPKLIDNNGRFQSSVLLRPPRFGKTLFLSMLECYFDERFKKQYEALFGHLAVASEDILLRNNMHVLQIELPTTCVNFEAKFHTEINGAIDNFLEMRELEVKTRSGRPIINDTDANNSLTNLATLLARKKATTADDRKKATTADDTGMLLVLVDEYDRAVVDAIATRNKAGIKTTLNQLNEFLGTLKKLNKTSIRFFVTGITPLAVSDSNFNVHGSLTHSPYFSNVMGLTEEEVEREIRETTTLNDAHRKRMMEVLKKYCNGYLFIGSNKPVYNPQLVHHILKQAAENPVDYMKQIATDELVTKRLSLITDFNQLVHKTQLDLIDSLPQLREMLTKTLIEKDAVVKPSDDGRLKVLFTAGEIDCNAASYLYYRGVLTAAAENSTVDSVTAAENSTVDSVTAAENSTVDSVTAAKNSTVDSVTLKMPNEIVKHTFTKDLRERLQARVKGAGAFLAAPSAQGLQDLVNQLLAQYDSDESNQLDTWKEADFVNWVARLFDPKKVLQNKGVEFDHLRGRLLDSFMQKFDEEFPDADGSVKPHSKQTEPDMEIKADDSTLFIEFKTITSTVKGRKLRDVDKNKVKSMSDKQILDLGISFSAINAYKPKEKTVAVLQKAAASQVRLPLYAATWSQPDKTHRAFTCIQVHNRCIVSEVTLDGLPLPGDEDDAAS